MRHETTYPAMPQGVRASLFWRMGWALLLALCAVLALAGRADAEPRIKVNCDIYATNHVDPIANTDHLHHHFGNTTTTNSSTGELLFNAG